MTGFVTCGWCGGPVVLEAAGRPKVYAFCDAPACQQAANAARARAWRAGKRLRPIAPPLPDHVRTVQGSNAALIAAVAKLYLKDGALVADPTWGKGVFWKRLDARRRFTLLGS